MDGSLEQTIEVLNFFNGKNFPKISTEYEAKRYLKKEDFGLQNFVTKTVLALILFLSIIKRLPFLQLGRGKDVFICHSHLLSQL